MAFRAGNFIVTKKITSSTLTTSAVNILQSVGNGLVIEDIVAVTDSTGLAGGTNFILKANGVTFFSTAVSGLGASSVIDIENASVTGSKVALPEGTKYITAENSVAVGTGAGVITLYITYKPVDSNVSMNAL